MAEDEEHAKEVAFEEGNFGYLCHLCSDHIDIDEVPMIDPKTGREEIRVEPGDPEDVEEWG